jgi:branched-chain amino acid transport system ATP-binding protein
MANHLRCENVTVRYGGLVACDRVSLSVEEGRIVGLIGPNGAGKTTLFNVLSRFQDMAQGHVYYRDRLIDRFKPHAMAGLGMARTFQNINLFKDQTVRDNILIGAHTAAGSPFAAMLGLPRARRRERELERRAQETAELLRLEHALDSPVRNLPYGHQKRVEIARALASKPELLLLDEPVAGCDDQETAEIRAIVLGLHRELGMTIVLVEHDMAMVMKVCDFVYVINFGANLCSGTPQQMQRHPDVIRAYLGEDRPA